MLQRIGSEFVIEGAFGGSAQIADAFGQADGRLAVLLGERADVDGDGDLDFLDVVTVLDIETPEEQTAFGVTDADAVAITLNSTVAVIGADIDFTGGGSEVLVQQFSFSGFRVGGVQVADTIESGAHFISDSIRRADGELVFAATRNPPGPGNETVVAATFDTASTLGAAEPVGDGFRGFLTEIAEGRSLAVFNAEGPGGTSELRSVILDADGAPEGPSTLVASSATVTFVPTDAITLTNGTVAVVYDALGEDDPVNVAVRLLSAEGEAFGAPILVNQTVEAAQSGGSAVALQNGFAVGWTDSAGDGSGSAVRTRLFDLTGAPLGPEERLNIPTEGAQTGLQLVPLGADRLAAIYVDESSGAAETRAQLFDTTGSLSGPTAVDDQASAPADTAILVSVLANDTDTGGLPLSLTSATIGQGGFAIVTDDQILFRARPDFEGIARIAYTAENADGAVDTGTLSVTVTPDAGPPVRVSDAQTVAALYEAALDRDGAIDLPGLNFWVNALTPSGGGLSLLQIAGAFTRSTEFEAAFGEVDALSDAEFIELLYQNVLERAADAAGLAFWSGALDALGGDRDRLLLAFADSNENLAGTPEIAALMEVAPGQWDFVG